MEYSNEVKWAVVKDELSVYESRNHGEVWDEKCVSN